MTSETSGVLLHAFLDGELDAASTIEVESRLKASTALRQELARLSALQISVQSRATRFTAPSAFRQSLFVPLPASQSSAAPIGVPRWWRGLAIGTSIAALAIVVASLGFIFTAGDKSSALVEEVVSAHVRSLLADHLTDLASKERHQVKPWLSNRLDFAPPVLDLANEGFALVGGRLDYLGGKPAAALVYLYRQHIINVFVWPSAPSRDHSIRASTHRGYNTVQFASDGMSYWAVSDLNPHDLDKLAKLFQLAQPAN
jgi:anti-sigma factor RsiW